MTDASWKLIDKWKNKPQGQVWRVRDARGRSGFFKFAYPEQWYNAGPLVGNEWIATALAEKLHLPCASVEITELTDGPHCLHGIVSLPRQGVHLFSWNRAPEQIRTNPPHYLRDFDHLLDVIAFDVWLTNIDRGSGKNIILYRDHAMYNWYLIDHAYCAYGCDRKWQPAKWTELYWKQVWQFYHIPRGWLQFIKPERLLRAAQKIAALPERSIAELIATVPDPLYSQSIKDQVTTMLLTRKQELGEILTTWIHYQGTKESRV
ncbi:HipA family kinase [Sulfoacidibacillus thermotolerans]|uniref:HipA-like kinase domain-containing protein n=1 Tax=Sulfoacidibacillus thermotolerans TaxID=1765684 RepID=A0A2U3D7B0_SULT2|nr:HipA family kinase [Sulfoacidibacillus thermotolerans]PWI57165.1 hypothetical protein BM613_09845 [Sulfoacidibacillus thermotolerans]